MKYLITGATGNIGKNILKALEQPAWAAVRHVEEANFSPKMEPVIFDFLDLEKSRPALEAADGLFLLRPPQLADIDTIFAPLIALLPECGIRHIIFLSVQGAADNKRIPHYKMEQLLLQSAIPHTFIRPSYFMQNLETQLHADLVERDEVFLPAGKAPFSWIDAEDIGAFIAKIMENPEPHFEKSYTLTAQSYHTFAEVADLLSRALGRPIRFRSPNLLHFMYRKWREGMPFNFILVLIMLHYLPRFGSPPPFSDDFEQLMKRKPRPLEQYIQEKAVEGL